MTAKEYLSQAYRLDQRIDSKIEQVASLNDLATKCTSTMTGMPRNPSGSTSTMADTVCKIIDLQAEINRDIDALVELKREIIGAIKAVENPEYQTLLEKRNLLPALGADCGGHELRHRQHLQAPQESTGLRGRAGRCTVTSMVLQPPLMILLQ